MERKVTDFYLQLGFKDKLRSLGKPQMDIDFFLGFNHYNNKLKQ